MSFIPQQYDDGQVVSLLTALDTTITKHDALAFSGGYIQRATGTTTEVRYVALEDVVTGASVHLPIMCVETTGVRFKATTTDDMAQTYVDTKVDLTDHVSLDENSAGTDYVFFIESMVGATTDKECMGYFVHKIT